MVEHFKRTEKVLEQVTSHRGLRFQLLTWGRHRDPLRDMLSSSVHVNKALGMEQVPPEQKPGRWRRPLHLPAQQSSPSCSNHPLWEISDNATLFSSVSVQCLLYGCVTKDPGCHPGTEFSRAPGTRLRLINASCCYHEDSHFSCPAGSSPLVYKHVLVFSS